mmetsp:Transcript_10401/g.63471  ORF Transcript_10401/g.63471 Transcript_10401/m.63471 type:complete len:382 (-) Transcript_10401:2273-3418(-)
MLWHSADATFLVHGVGREVGRELHQIHPAGPAHGSLPLGRTLFRLRGCLRDGIATEPGWREGCFGASRRCRSASHDVPTSRASLVRDVQCHQACHACEDAVGRIRGKDGRRSYLRRADEARVGFQAGHHAGCNLGRGRLFRPREEPVRRNLGRPVPAFRRVRRSDHLALQQRRGGLSFPGHQPSMVPRFGVHAIPALQAHVDVGKGSPQVHFRYVDAALARDAAELGGSGRRRPLNGRSRTDVRVRAFLHGSRRWRLSLVSRGGGRTADRDAVRSTATTRPSFCFTTSRARVVHVPPRSFPPPLLLSVAPSDAPFHPPSLPRPFVPVRLASPRRQSSNTNANQKTQEEDQDDKRRRWRWTTTTTKRRRRWWRWRWKATTFR